MQIGVVGVSHKFATLEQRERLADLKSIPGCVVLSTCNRVEVYFSGDIPPVTIPHGYTLFGAACFSHLAAVAAGLDSQLFGETDIKRQVRIAYEEAEMLSVELHYLFQKSFKMAKEVRMHCAFQTRDVLEDTVFKLVDAFAGENPQLLFIGFSSVNRRLAAQWKKGTLVTQGGEGWKGIEVKGREELKRVHLYDAVIAATRADEYLVSKLEASGQTKLILDLSLPRVVDPRVGKQCLLLNIEQIGELAAKLQVNSQVEIEKAKNLIDSWVAGYLERFVSRRLMTCV